MSALCEGSPVCTTFAENHRVDILDGLTSGIVRVGVLENESTLCNRTVPRPWHGL